MALGKTGGVAFAVPKPGESLADLFPDVAAQWHPTKNGDLLPTGVVAGSGRKVWWKCPEGPDHEWDAKVDHRTRSGSGCPACAGQAVSVTNSLASLFPEIAAEWHPTKNGDLLPTGVVAGSGRKVWWKCPEGPDHEWDDWIGHRTLRGHGCPCCSGRRLSITNSFAALAPEVAKQWHPTKNHPLTPDQVIAGHRTKVWWKCPKGPDHEWDAAPSTRYHQEVGCPCCDGKRPSVTNSLATLFPELATEWHPTKNGELSPTEVVAGSEKKVWWNCDVAEDHEWRSTPSNRAYRGAGCLACAGKQVSTTNSFVELFPEIAAEWHPTKNGDFKVNEFIANSNRLSWWKCDVADDHEWETSIANRTHHGSGCACCAGQKVSVTNSLASLFPEIAAEWHPTRNGEVTPAQVTSGTNSKQWWQCSISGDHKWETSVKNRARRGTGCPNCTLTPRSAQEMRLAYELSALIDFDLEAHKVRFAGQLRDVDIMLEHLGVIVEFDGSHWHRNKVDKDREKTALMEEAGWQVIRVRERPLDSIHVNDVMVDTMAPAKTVADLVLNKIGEVTGTEIPRLDEYLASEGPWRDAEALKAIRAYQAERAAKKAARANKAD